MVQASHNSAVYVTAGNRFWCIYKVSSIVMQVQILQYIKHDFWGIDTISCEKVTNSNVKEGINATKGKLRNTVSNKYAVLTLKYFIQKHFREKINVVLHILL